MRVALATCRVLPEPDPDETLLLQALAEQGLEPYLLPWDDHSVSAAEADLCVIRSTWNYYRDHAGFLRWATAASAMTQLLNPLPVVRWNSHKSYLRALAARQIRVIPTCFLERGAPARLGDVMSEHGWSEVVVKPTVSAGSFQTRRFSVHEREEGEDFLATLVRERDVMVQPHVRMLQSYGEHALVWIDGAFTHAVRKSPRFSGQDEAVSAALPISDEEERFALQVLETVESDLLYGRVDVARGDDGALMVMELELIEPSLFLRQCPPALARFAAAIRARLG